VSQRTATAPCASPCVSSPDGSAIAAPCRMCDQSTNALNSFPISVVSCVASTDLLSVRFTNRDLTCGSAQSREVVNGVRKDSGPVRL